MNNEVKNTLSGSEARSRTEEHKKQAKRGKRGKRGKLLESLNAWACLLALHPRGSGVSLAQAGGAEEIWRTDTVRLVPTPGQEEILRMVGDATARLINAENYRRRHLFFENKEVDASWDSVWRRRKEEYKDVYDSLGSANFHETCRFISQAWKSFKEVLKARKEGRLMAWMKPTSTRLQQKRWAARTQQSS